MLAHARCMREHGIDVPDPKPGGELVRIDKSIDPAKVDAAMKACASLVEERRRQAADAGGDGEEASSRP